MTSPDRPDPPVVERVAAAPPARKRGALQALRFLSPLLVLAMALGAMKVLIDSREQPVVVPPEPYRPIVEVIRVEPTDVDHEIRASGEVSSYGSIDLVPQVGGKIVAVSPLLRAGAFFTAGELLLEVEADDHRRRCTIAAAAVREAEVALETETAQGEIARSEWETLSIGEGSPLALREPQRRLAEARLSAARARLEQAEQDLERTRILAPFDGRVLSSRAEVGQVVAPGGPIARLTRTDRAEVVLPVLDADLALLDLPLLPTATGSFEGPEVELTARFAGEARRWVGTIRRIEGELDPRTRMVRLVAEVPEPFGRARGESGAAPLPSGLFVEARIRGVRSAGVFAVPRAAWREGRHLLVVGAEDRLSIRVPELIRVERDRVIVRRGLEAGERLVVTPIEAAVDGMPVRPIEAPRAIGARP